MLHNTTQDYIRKMLNARLEALTAELIGISAVADEKGGHRVNELITEIRTVSASIADLLTHHMDEPKPEPAAPAETEEDRAAKHLYQQIMRSASAIRDLEVKLGMSEQNGTRAHNLMKDMRQFVEARQTMNAAASIIEPVIPHKAVNGLGPRR